MNIAIIGAGKVGGALAKRWEEAGHRVWVGARDPQSEKTRLYALSVGENVRVTGVAEAAAEADALLLATPWDKASIALKAAGDLTDKILMDATNPLLPGGKVSIGFNTSAAEEIAQWTGARVVKAFSTTGVANMIRPDYDGMKTDIFICGDDFEAKETVCDLIHDLGLNPIDCGPLYMARNLEPLAALWVYLAYNAGYGPDFMFKLVHRPEN
jgi:predicted dinucleotide-binding enzyme